MLLETKLHTRYMTDKIVDFTHQITHTEDKVCLPYDCPPNSQYARTKKRSNAISCNIYYKLKPD